MKLARPELGHWSSAKLVEAGTGVGLLVIAALGPFIFSDYWAHQLLTYTFLLGIAAASLIFLSAYGGMVSLAQAALYGVSAFTIGNLVTKGGAGGTSKGLHLGWNPTASMLVAIGLTTALGFVLGLVSARSAGIYFLMITLTYAVIANLFFQNVTNVSGFSGIGGIDRALPGWIGAASHPNRLYYISLGVALAAYLLIKYIVRTPFGVALQGVRDEPVRMSSLGYNVPLIRALAFAFAAFLASFAGILYVALYGQIAPDTVGLGGNVSLLIAAVIGGLSRIEGAWIGAFAYIIINNELHDVHIPGLGFGGVLFGGSFNTLIGIIFLVIVIASPGGLMGVWERLLGLLTSRKPASGAAEAQTTSSGV